MVKCRAKLFCRLMVRALYQEAASQFWASMLLNGTGAPPTGKPAAWASACWIAKPHAKSTLLEAPGPPHPVAAPTPVANDGLGPDFRKKLKNAGVAIRPTGLPVQFGPSRPRPSAPGARF